MAPQASRSLSKPVLALNIETCGTENTSSPEL